MKKYLMFLICSLLVFSISLPVLAGNNVLETVVNNLNADENLDKIINEGAANIDSDDNLKSIIEYGIDQTTKKSKEGLKPSGNLKVYGFKDKQIDVLNKFSNGKSLGSLISKDFGILKPYVNKNNEIAYSIFFLPESTIKVPETPKKVANGEKGSGKKPVIVEEEYNMPLVKMDGMLLVLAC